MRIGSKFWWGTAWSRTRGGLFLPNCLNNWVFSTSWTKLSNARTEGMLVEAASTWCFRSDHIFTSMTTAVDFIFKPHLYPVGSFMDDFTIGVIQRSVVTLFKFIGLTVNRYPQGHPLYRWTEYIPYNERRLLMHSKGGWATNERWTTMRCSLGFISHGQRWLLSFHPGIAQDSCGTMNFTASNFHGLWN